MIEWSENTTCEVALSFQEKAACDDLWKRIHEVKSGHSKSSGSLYKLSNIVI